MNYLMLNNLFKLPKIVLISDKKKNNVRKVNPTTVPPFVLH